MPRRRATRRHAVTRRPRSGGLAIVDLLIPVGHPNRGGMRLQAYGVVWHRTSGDHGASWLAGYFGRSPHDFQRSTWRYGSSHYGVDDVMVARYVPDNEVAWHVAGDTPEQNQNAKRLGVELCQYMDEPPRIRPPTYARAVRLGAELCRRYGWRGPRERATDGAPRFTRHSDWQSDRRYDPGDFLPWKTFLDDVEAAMGGTWMPEEESDMADYTKIEEQVKRTIRAVILNEPQLVTSAILHPSGYGPRLQAALDQMMRTRTRGIRSRGAAALFPRVDREPLPTPRARPKATRTRRAAARTRAPRPRS